MQDSCDMHNATHTMYPLHATQLHASAQTSARSAACRRPQVPRHPDLRHPPSLPKLGGAPVGEGMGCSGAPNAPAIARAGCCGCCGGLGF